MVKLFFFRELHRHFREGVLGDVKERGKSVLAGNVHLGFAATLSDFLLENEWAVGIGRTFGAMMLDPAVPFGAEIVETDGIGVEVEEVKEFAFEFSVLGGIDFAFEDGILDSLAVVEGDFGCAAQAA